MESNESLIDDFAENNKPPKKRGWLATILFGKKFTWGGCLLRLIHTIVFLYIAISGLFIAFFIFAINSTTEDSVDPEANEMANFEDIKYDIESKTEILRGLSLSEEIEERILTEEEFNADLEEGYDEEEIDEDGIYQIEMEMLGFLTSAQDFSQMYSDYAVGNIIAYYDTEENEITMGEIMSDDPFELMTISHEYTHALQDHLLNTFENELSDPDYCSLFPDRCEAFDALIEGDASLTEEQWYFNNASGFEKGIYGIFLYLYDLAPELIKAIFSETSTFLDMDFGFPYEQGKNFVKQLYNSGGWEEVNAAYQQVPKSTEQILHPERYPEDHPIVVNSPDMNKILGETWETNSQYTLGEWWLYLTLAYGYDKAFQLPHHEAAVATKGWGGDILMIYRNPSTQERVLLLRSSWDTLKDAMEFGRAFSKYGFLRWGKPDISNSRQVIWEQTSDGFVELYFLNNEVVWMITPDAELAGTLIDALPLFDN